MANSGNIHDKFMVLVPGVFNEDATMVKSDAHTANVNFLRPKDVFVPGEVVDNEVVRKRFFGTCSNDFMLDHKVVLTFR